MAFGIVGSPTQIASGSNYTPGAGSNRLVVILAAQKSLGYSLTNITYNGVTRTPAVQITDQPTADRTGVGICIFKESELPGGASAATATWSGAASDVLLFCYTISDADQTTTVRTSGSAQGNTASGLTSSIAQTVTVGDIQLGVVSFRNNVPNFIVPQNSWTEDFDVTSGGNSGTLGAAHFTASGTSSPCRWLDNSGGSDDSYSLATVALMPFTGGGSSIAAISNYYRMLRNG